MPGSRPAISAEGLRHRQDPRPDRPLQGRLASQGFEQWAPFRGGTTPGRPPGIGDHLLHGLPPGMRLLSELRHQPSPGWRGGRPRGPGRDDARPSGSGVSQHQSCHAHPLRSSDLEGGRPGGRPGSEAASGLQLQRLRNDRHPETAGGDRRHLYAGLQILAGASALRYCEAPDYPGVAAAAVREMHGQVGDLVVEDGLAFRGLLVRHLVMPGGGAETAAILDFLAREISPDTFVNVMDQYRPCHRAGEFPEISRRLERDEFTRAISAAARAGLKRVCT